MRKLAIVVATTVVVLLLLVTTNNGVYAFQSSPFVASPLEGHAKDGKCRAGEFECSNRKVCVQEGDKCLACQEGYQYQAGVGCYKCPEKTSLKNKNGSWVCE